MLQQYSTVTDLYTPTPYMKVVTSQKGVYRKAVEFIESWKSERVTRVVTLYKIVITITTIQYCDYDCVLKALMVKCCLIPWIDTNVHSIDTRSMLNRHSINTSVDTRWTLKWHLRQQSVGSQLFFDWYIWVYWHSTDYWPDVEQVLMECQPRINWDVNWV